MKTIFTVFLSVMERISHKVLIFSPFWLLAGKEGDRDRAVPGGRGGRQS